MTREEIFSWVKETYGTTPEYLWSGYPNYAVLRNDNNKWYGIIMDVPKCNLGLDGTEIIDIMDVKCDPILMGSYRKQKGFLPAYHMSKSHWISIIISEADTEDIKYLIDVSKKLTSK